MQGYAMAMPSCAYGIALHPDSEAKGEGFFADATQGGGGFFWVCLQHVATQVRVECVGWGLEVGEDWFT